MVLVTCEPRPSAGMTRSVKVKFKELLQSAIEAIGN